MSFVLALVLAATQAGQPQGAPTAQAAAARPAIAPVRTGDVRSPRPVGPTAVPLLAQTQSAAQAAQEDLPEPDPQAADPPEAAQPQAAQPEAAQPRGTPPARVQPQAQPQSGRPPPPVIDQPQSGGNSGCSCDLAAPLRNGTRLLWLACAMLGGMLLGRRRWR